MNKSSGRHFLHLVPDEKFIDAAYRSFETEAPGENRFIVVGGGRRLGHILTFEPERIPVHALADSEFLSHLSSYDAVFIHFLWGHSRVVVSEAPENVTFVWIGWGSDYYHLIESGDHPLLLPQTANLRQRLGDKTSVRLRNLIRAVAARTRHPKLQGRLDQKTKEVGARGPGEAALLRRISYFAPVLPSEYERVAAAVPGFRAGYISWNYKLPFDVHSIVREPKDPAGEDILVGNSATWENNHLEAFEILSGHCPGRRVLCPLAYGDRVYGKEIEKAGFAKFGTAFQPLKEFLPHQKYEEVLRSCSIVVMNHVRQQGLGNILLMLALGAKVFLRKENPIFDFLVEKGAHVFEFAMLRHELERREPLQLDLVKHNQRIVLRSGFDTDSINQRTRKMLEIVTGGTAA